MSLHIDSTLSIDQLPAECISDCSTPGQDAAPAVDHWRRTLGFTVDRARAIACLKGYGAWEDLPDQTDEDLAEKILWIACCNFREWDGTIDPTSGSDIFCLE